AMPGPAIEELRQQAKILDEAYEFVARIQLPLEDKRLNERRSAQLHAIDHLLRLLGRVQSMTNSEAALHGLHHETALEHANAIKRAKNMAHTAQQGLDGQAHATWLQELEAESAALADMLHRARRELLAGPFAGDETLSSLRTTETYRWLERTSNHIWRASH